MQGYLYWATMKGLENGEIERLGPRSPIRHSSRSGMVTITNILHLAEVRMLKGTTTPANKFSTHQGSGPRLRSKIPVNRLPALWLRFVFSSRSTLDLRATSASAFVFSG